MILNVNNVFAGKKYKIIRSFLSGIDMFAFPNEYVGCIGLCRWANGDGACLRVANQHGEKHDIIVPYGALGIAVVDVRKFRSVPTIADIDFNIQEYRIAKLPDINAWNVGLVGQICSIITTSNQNKDVVIMIGNDPNLLSIPMDCLEYVGA